MPTNAIYDALGHLFVYSSLLLKFFSCNDQSVLGVALKCFGGI